MYVCTYVQTACRITTRHPPPVPFSSCARSKVQMQSPRACSTYPPPRVQSGVATETDSRRGGGREGRVSTERRPQDGCQTKGTSRTQPAKTTERCFNLTGAGPTSEYINQVKRYTISNDYERCKKRVNTYTRYK